MGGSGGEIWEGKEGKNGAYLAKGGITEKGFAIQFKNYFSKK